MQHRTDMGVQYICSGSGRSSYRGVVFVSRSGDGDAYRPTIKTYRDLLLLPRSVRSIGFRRFIPDLLNIISNNKMKTLRCS